MNSTPLLLACLVAAGSFGCGPSKSSTAAVTEMPSLDHRTPLPLLPMMAEHQKQQMRGHLVAVHDIVAALSTDDFAAVEEASKKIGFSDSMGRMCNHLGAGAPAFAATAVSFHHTADTIGAAAKKKDRGSVLAALTTTLDACTSCHATYKQQVVDEATWNQLTGAAMPTPPPN